jgi:omega-hydroxy-beta-dihydromenaquinone-9 sulfotransferase
MSSAMVETQGEPVAEGDGPTPQPVLWALCTLSGWLRLLARNVRFLDLWCWRWVLSNTALSAVASAMGLLQEMRYGRKVARTPLVAPPLFVLGHWRSGTTFLNNLLCLDERHTFPTNLECFTPNHFLLSEDFLLRRLRARFSARRAFDNVADGLDIPQEDEYALCMMGLPSPLLDSAFPCAPPQCPEYLDLEGVPPHARAAWKQGLLRFLQRITLRRPKRLILKSPQHTGRIKVLLELFPDAQFIHIVRNPYVVFLSTMKMYPQAFLRTSFQKPPYTGLEEYVFATYVRMFQRLEEGRRLVAPERFFELRYEDLVRDPVGQVRAIYDHFGLGGFDEMRPRLDQYLAGLGEYQTNRHYLSRELQAKITQRWGDVIRRYGYTKESVPV